MPGRRFDRVCGIRHSGPQKHLLRDAVSPLSDVVFLGEPESFRFVKGTGFVEAFECPEIDPPVSRFTAEIDGLED